MIRDPATRWLSSTRVAACLCVVAGIVVGAFTVRFAFLHPESHEMAKVLAGLVTTLCVTAGVSLFLRSKPSAGTTQEPPQ